MPPPNIESSTSKLTSHKERAPSSRGGEDSTQLNRPIPASRLSLQQQKLPTAASELVKQDSESLNSSPEHAAYAKVNKKTKQTPPSKLYVNVNVSASNMENVSSASVGQLETGSATMTTSPSKELATGSIGRRRSVSSKSILETIFRFCLYSLNYITFCPYVGLEI